MASKRGKRVMTSRNDIEIVTIPEYCKNIFHLETNKSGMISFCTAENMLCEDIVSAKIKEHLSSSFERDWLYYPPQFWGTLRFRRIICDILNTHFNPHEIILPDNIVIGAGATAMTSMVCIAVMNPGDCMLCLTPQYFRSMHYIGDEASVEWYNVPMIERNQFEVSGAHGAEQIEKCYKKAVSEGHKVKGLFMINPDNSSGKIYSESELKAIFKVCKKYDLHVVIDEVYALSVYSEAKFTSVLSIKDLPDPKRMYFIWGLSKDFCLNGFRCGVIYTNDKDISNVLKQLASYHMVSVPIQSILSNVLSDEGSAGFFIWADFTEFLHDHTFDKEYKLFLEFAENGVLIFPGFRFYSSTPGFFRIVFTVPLDHLNEGLARMKQVCQKRRMMKNCN